MGAIRFPLIFDTPGATSDAPPQQAARLGPAAGSQSTALQDDVVTLSAVFPPAAPAAPLNFVPFQNSGQPPVQAFPPPPTQANAPALPQRLTNPSAPPTLSQQEQLAHLDQALEQLGINPQSISLDNRLALLKSANDPPALLNLVRALGASQTIASSLQLAATSASNLSNPGQAGATVELPAQPETQVQPPIQANAAFQNSSPPAAPGFEANLQASAETFQPPPAASGAAAQFQQIQLIFQSSEGSPAPPAENSSGSEAPSKRTSLNVRA